jgi:hypothetical protein
MHDYLRHHLFEEARRLTPDEHFLLIQELLTLYHERITHPEAEKPSHSITELEGLGAEIWEGIDAQEYVNELRGSRGE